MNTAGLVDIHQHVLWGVDDGPKTPEQMYALLRQDMEEGIHFVFATAHAYPQRCPFDLTLYRERLSEANDYCRSMGWPLRILPGCEIFYSSAVPDLLACGKLPAMGGSRYVLIEFMPNVSPDRIRDAADSLYRAGYLPIAAHVERYHCLTGAPQKAMDIRDEYGLMYQINGSSVLFPGHFRKRRFVRAMLAARMIDFIATDAHDVIVRPVRMQSVYQKIEREYDEKYAGQLFFAGRKMIEINLGE